MSLPLQQGFSGLGFTLLVKTEKEKSYLRGRLSTVDLHPLNTVDKLLLISKYYKPFSKTGYCNEEVNCTKPSPSVSIPYSWSYQFFAILSTIARSRVRTRTLNPEMRRRCSTTVLPQLALVSLLKFQTKLKCFKFIKHNNTKFKQNSCIKKHKTIN